MSLLTKRTMLVLNIQTHTFYSQEVDAALRETANLRSSSTEEARALRAELQAERTRRANNGVVSSPELEVKIKSLTEV